MPGPNYKEDAEENKEFDKTLNPQGTFQKPSVEQLRKGVKIKNKSRYRSGEGSQEFLNNSGPLKLLSDAATGLDKATGLHNKRMKIVQPAANIHPVLGVAADILTPDSTDLIAPGGGFTKRIAANAPLGIKLARKGYEAIVDTVTNSLSKRKVFGQEFAGDARALGNWGYADDLAEQSAQPMLSKSNNPMSGGNPIPKKFGDVHVPANISDISKNTQKLLNKHVLVNGKFNYNEFKKLYTGNNAISRQIASILETTPHFRQQNWDKTRQGLVDIFEGIYGDIMDVKGMTRQDIHIDHLVTLRSTMPLYDDVAYGSPLWNRIQEAILSRGYKSGDTLSNYNALERGSDIVKTNFFNTRLGKDGEKFFTPAKLEYMKKSDANRMEVLKDWLAIQDEGTQILREAQYVWETLYKIDGAELPEEILNKLSKIPIGKYSHPELRNLKQLKSIVKDIIEDEWVRSQKNIDKGYKSLKNRINDPNFKMKVKKKKPLPTQNQLNKKTKEAGTTYQPTLDPEGGTLL